MCCSCQQFTYIRYLLNLRRFYYVTFCEKQITSRNGAFKRILELNYTSQCPLYVKYVQFIIYLIESRILGNVNREAFYLFDFKFVIHTVLIFFIRRRKACGIFNPYVRPIACKCRCIKCCKDVLQINF